jgi:hypothetical protein
MIARAKQTQTRDAQSPPQSTARSQAGPHSVKRQAGTWGYILLWLLGVPIPVLFLFYLLRGCT